MADLAIRRNSGTRKTSLPIGAIFLRSLEESPLVLFHRRKRFAARDQDPRAAVWEDFTLGLYPQPDEAWRERVRNAVNRHARPPVGRSFSPMNALPEVLHREVTGEGPAAPRTTARTVPR
jgi:hypothetical protein